MLAVWRWKKHFVTAGTTCRIKPARLTMFRAFPKSRDEWWRVLLFPFQAYIVVAYIVEQYFITSLPGYGGYRGALTDFKAWVIFGYAICFVVLLCTGAIQFLRGHRLRGAVNVGLALLGVLIGLSMANFVS